MDYEPTRIYLDCPGTDLGLDLAVYQTRVTGSAAFDVRRNPICNCSVDPRCIHKADESTYSTREARLESDCDYRISLIFYQLRSGVLGREPDAVGTGRGAPHHDPCFWFNHRPLLLAGRAHNRRSRSWCC